MVVKGTDPIMTRRFRDRKIKFLRKRKSIKLEIQTFIQPYSSLPTNYDVKMGSAVCIKAFSGLACLISGLTASSEVLLPGHKK